MGIACGKEDNQNFMTFIHQGDLKSIKHAIENKLESDSSAFTINSPVNKMDDTLLHYAVYKKNLEIVDFLLVKGADPHKKNSRNITPVELCDQVPGAEQIKQRLSK